MYLVLYLDQTNYQFNTSLHTTREGAEAAYEDMLRWFEVFHRMDAEPLKSGDPLPPKSEWSGLFDNCGEGVHLYRIEPDGGPGEQIWLERDLKAA